MSPPACLLNPGALRRQIGAACVRARPRCHHTACTARWPWRSRCKVCWLPPLLYPLGSLLHRPHAGQLKQAGDPAPRAHGRRNAKPGFRTQHRMLSAPAAAHDILLGRIMLLGCAAAPTPSREHAHRWDQAIRVSPFMQRTLPLGTSS